MADIVNSLFGIDPAALQQARATTDFAQAYKFAQLDPFERANMALYQSGAQIARGAGQLLGGDDQLTRASSLRSLANQFDLTTPEGLRQYAEAAAGIDPRVSAQAAAEAERRTLVQARTTAALREREPSPETQAERDYAAAVYARYPDTIEGRAAAANEFAEWKNKRKKEVAAAGATVMPGEAKIPDLRTAQSIVNDYLGKSKESLSTIKTISNYGEMIKAGNSSQLPQFQRALVKLVGDSQIGQNELKNILGSGGIAADLVDGVTKFMTGAPSNAKIDDVLKGVKVLERQVQESYRSGQDQARRVLTNSKFDTKIVDDLVGPSLKTTPPAGKTKAVPKLADWLVQARAANPNVSDADLTSFYNKKYSQ
jgi:hypothetical protein